jgi:hypothetical protein
LQEIHIALQKARAKSRTVGLAALEALSDKKLETFASDYEFVAKLAKLNTNSLDKVFRLFFKNKKYYQHYKAVAAIIGEKQM